MTDPADGALVLAKRGEPSNPGTSASANGVSTEKTSQSLQPAADGTVDSSPSETDRMGEGGLDEQEEQAPSDRFESAVWEAFRATSRAFPGGRVLAHIDLK